MATNPILSEIMGLSPQAKSALGMAGHTVPPPVDPSLAGANGTTGQPAPSMAPSAMPAPSASAPPTLSTAPPPAKGTTLGDSAERTRLLSTGSGISQIGDKIENSRIGQAHPMFGKLLGGVAQGAATLGDIGLSAVAPGIATNLPGTAYHHQALLNHANTELTQDEANAGKEAQTRGETATAGKTEAETPFVAPEANSRIALQGSQAKEADARAAAVTQTAQTEADKAKAENFEVHDTEDGPVLFNKKDGTAQHLTVDGSPVGAKVKLTQSQPIIGSDGKPHTYMLDEKGKKVVDLGEHYERPQVTNINENHQFAEQERGRGLLDKGEQSYRAAQQSANVMRQMVDNAKQGDKMSAKMLPLEGALEITTAQGTKRINRTEVDQYAGGGSAFDKLAGMLKGAATGIPFTNEIMQSMAHLADIEEKGAYDNYKGGYDSAVRRYGLKDEQALPAPGGGGPESSGMAVSLADARNLPQNKGKSDADITADIKAHGHEVNP